MFLSLRSSWLNGIRFKKKNWKKNHSAFEYGFHVRFPFPLLVGLRFLIYVKPTWIASDLENLVVNLVASDLLNLVVTRAGNLALVDFRIPIPIRIRILMRLRKEDIPHTHTPTHPRSIKRASSLPAMANNSLPHSSLAPCPSSPSHLQHRLSNPGVHLHRFSFWKIVFLCWDGEPTTFCRSGEESFFLRRCTAFDWRN